MKKSLFLSISFLCLFFEAVTASSLFLPDGDDLKASKTKEETSHMIKETWEFYSTSIEPTAEELQLTDNHKFGKEVAFLYTAFMDIYVIKEEVVPGDPSRRTVIRKPGIYNAVRSIEKQLNKDVKNNIITTDIAAQEFSEVLKVALAAIDSESQTFEEALQKNKKDSALLLAIFENVSLKSIY